MLIKELKIYLPEYNMLNKIISKLTKLNKTLSITLTKKQAQWHLTEGRPSEPSTGKSERKNWHQPSTHSTEQTST
jgi:hypothetical protein